MRRKSLLIGCTSALLAGDWFLGWRAPRPLSVLYLSGAASSAVLGARLAAALRTMRGGATVGQRLQLVTPDLHRAALPALDTAGGQAALMPMLAAADVLVIDDAAALLPGMASNPARSQWRFGEFLRQLRHAGRGVLIGQASGEGPAHDAGRRIRACIEAQADIVVGLRRPADYAVDDGARFELHVERANHLPGAVRQPREIRFGGEGRTMWQAARALDLSRRRFFALLDEGMPAAEAARALGLERTTAWRWSRRYPGPHPAAVGDPPVPPAQGADAAEPVEAAAMAPVIDTQDVKVA